MGTFMNKFYAAWLQNLTRKFKKSYLSITIAANFQSDSISFSSSIAFNLLVIYLISFKIDWKKTVVPLHCCRTVFVRVVSINVSERMLVESANCFPVLTRSEVFLNRMTNYCMVNLLPYCVYGKGLYRVLNPWLSSDELITTSK